MQPELQYDLYGNTISKGYYDRLHLESHFWQSEALIHQPIYIRHGFIAERWGESYFQHKRNRTFALELVLDGTYTAEEQGIRTTVEPGMLYFVPRKARTSLFSDTDGYYLKQVLLFEGDLLEIILKNLNLLQVKSLVLKDLTNIRLQYQNILDLLKNKIPGSESDIGICAYSLLLRIAKEHEALSTTYPHTLQKALAFIAQEFSQRIQLKQICREAGGSSATLDRLFRQHLKISPGEYLVNVRLEYACSLLQSSDIRIKEIAWRCGYRNQLYFSTAFQKRYGIAPRDYRNKRCLSSKPAYAKKLRSSNS